MKRKMGRKGPKTDACYIPILLSGRSEGIYLSVGMKLRAQENPTIYRHEVVLLKTLESIVLQPLRNDSLMDQNRLGLISQPLDFVEMFREEIYSTCSV